jgi:hypothetical protein
MRAFNSLRSREAFVAHLYGLRTVCHQGVLPRGGESILGYGLSYLLALHWVRLLAELREGIIGHQQNKAGYKCELRHGCSVLLWFVGLLRQCELAARLLVAELTISLGMIVGARP